MLIEPLRLAMKTSPRRLTLASTGVSGADSWIVPSGLASPEVPAAKIATARESGIVTRSNWCGPAGGGCGCEQAMAANVRQSVNARRETREQGKLQRCI